MSTAHRIANAIDLHPQGDLEKYFEFVSNMIELNSGTNDYKMVTHDSYALSVPIPENQTTRFRLTDSSMDIVDISQGYIALTVKMQIKIDALNPVEGNKEKKADPIVKSKVKDIAKFKDLVYFFVGFKSSAHILDSYTIYSNGRATACKQTKATAEQAIVFNCKAKEEIASRPGMYSVHSDVLKMRDCVAGVYIPVNAGNIGELMQIEFDLIISVDELLPLSAMEAYPCFECGDLELEIKCNLRNNMVFCQIPYDEVFKHRPIPKGVGSIQHKEKTVYKAGIDTLEDINAWIAASTYTIDSRFHQCGDWARCLLGVEPSESSDGEPLDCYVTINPTDLMIKDAKSYVHGFNIKEDAKDNISAIINEGNGLTIPAQWIDQTTFAQLPSNTKLTMNTIVSLFECGQVIITFPNSDKQLTVSRNPCLKSVKCQIGDKMIPSKNMSTLDRAHAEMCLTALGMDSLFSAPKTLTNSYTLNGAMNRTNDSNDALALLDNYHWRLKREDDSCYMFVCDLERNSAGTYADGLTAINCAISFDGDMINGVHNTHYYDYDPTKDYMYGENPAATDVNFTPKNFAPLLFTVSDAYWVFNKYGGEFIKDQSTIPLVNKISEKRMAQQRYGRQVANPDYYNEGMPPR